MILCLAYAADGLTAVRCPPQIGSWLQRRFALVSILVVARLKSSSEIPAVADAGFTRETRVRPIESVTFHLWLDGFKSADAGNRLWQAITTILQHLVKRPESARAFGGRPHQAVNLNVDAFGHMFQPAQRRPLARLRAGTTGRGWAWDESILSPIPDYIH